MKKDINKIISAFLIPFGFVTLLWMIKISETIWGWELYTYGVLPLHTSGLKGIVFSPLIHSGYDHLISNTFPLLILGWALFYFYRELGIRITLLAWVISGIWVWVFARESYHVGASGIIYSWAAFLFVSGVIRNHPRLMALSLLVAFLYGSMVWGIFPLRERVSWEGHLMGLLAGLLLALFYKQQGPQRKKYSWELEEDDDDQTDEYPYWMAPTASESGKQQQPSSNQENREKQKSRPIRVKYHYTGGKSGKPGNNNSSREQD